MRSRAAAALVASILAGCARFENEAPAVKRLVLVSIDTLHVDWTGPYNPEIATTPFLDRFASEGVRFERAYTEVPITLPAHASLMTGVSARTLGVLANGHHLRPEAETLAERLSAAGFRTAGFVSLGVLRPGFGLEQGFEHYPDPFESGSTRWYRTADEVLEPAGSWLRANAAERFFLWLHLSDPHAPYLPVDAPPDSELFVDGELAGRFSLASAERYRVPLTLEPGRHVIRFQSLRAPRPDDRPETALVLDLHAPEPLAGSFPLTLERELELEVGDGEEDGELELAFSGYLERPTPSDVLPSYEAEVAYVDTHLEKLDSLLGSLGVRDETLVAIVSDHGEGLFRHDLLGHATAVFEDQLRVVWMLRGPGVPRGRIVKTPAHLIDVSPTLLELMGIAGSAEGRPRVGCFTGARCPEPEPWWAFALDHDAARLTAMAGYRWPYKWIWERAQSRRGYEVVEDPEELNDLLANPGPHNPEPLKNAAETFRPIHRELSTKLRNAERSTETEDLLRSLGYLGGRRKE